MEKYHITQNLKVFGTQVKTFPEGIGEAFHNLIEMLPDGKNRSYYGISEFNNGRMVYYAAAEETFTGEAKKYNCETYTIEKGNYLTVAIHDWRSKTDSIKDVFGALLQNHSADKTKPCVEWYKNDDQMLCMVKTGTSKL